MGAIFNLCDIIFLPLHSAAKIPVAALSNPQTNNKSVSFRVALWLVVGLLAISAVRWLLILCFGEAIVWDEFLRNDVVPIVVMILAVSGVAWFGLKWWLEKEPSSFPDIDQALREAILAMRMQELDLTNLPIFIVLGPVSASEADEFMNATDLDFLIRVPEPFAGGEESVIHVYANSERIYVLCKRVGCVGTLRVEVEAAATRVSPQQINELAVMDFTRTMQVDIEDESDTNRTLDGYVESSFGVPAPVHQSVTVRLGERDFALASARLCYLVRRINRLRNPLCPINGILVATPFQLLADGTPETVSQLQSALDADLQTLRRISRVRCSVTHIVEGMQNEPGFREIIRRVGIERARKQRFGKGFGLWNSPKQDQLEAVVGHACGAFEDWSHALFRDESGFRDDEKSSNFGNRRLYQLLSRVRSQFLPRLKNLVKSAYAMDSATRNVISQEPMLFGGCYFVANGSGGDGQAFVASVFEKCFRDEEELQWGSEATAADERLRMVARVLAIINGLLVVSIIAILIYHCEFGH